jgi:hypothetical protein
MLNLKFRAFEQLMDRAASVLMVGLAVMVASAIAHGVV